MERATMSRQRSLKNPRCDAASVGANASHSFGRDSYAADEGVRGIAHPGEEDPMIPEELRAEIRRLHFVEKWPVGTIAAQLHLHHTTVKRVLAHPSAPPFGRPRRCSMLTPFLGLIFQTLEKFPTLNASRLYPIVA